MNTPYILTDRSLTAYIEGEAFTIDRSAPNFDLIVAELATPTDEATLRSLFGGYNKVTPAFEAEGHGLVTVSRNGVTYAGRTVNSALADRMVEIAEAGLPLDPWVRFMERVMANPAPWAQEELYLWLSASDLPITDDGCFLAYKKVSDNFTDIYSGSFDNSPGTTVVMPGGRPAVDTNRHNTCSTGLHFCSRSYLPHFGTADGNRVVLVKIDPADVVSIPADYGNAKGRTWKYEVVSEVEGISYEEMNFPPVVHVDGTNIFTEYVWFLPEDGDSDDWDDWEDEYDNGVATYAPSPSDIPEPVAVKGYWKGLWNKLTK